MGNDQGICIRFFMGGGQDSDMVAIAYKSAGGNEVTIYRPPFTDNVPDVVSEAAKAGINLRPVRDKYTDHLVTDNYIMCERELDVFSNEQ